MQTVLIDHDGEQVVLPQEAYMRYHHMRQDHKAKGSDHE